MTRHLLQPDLDRLEDRDVPAALSTLAVGGSLDGRATLFTPNNAGQLGSPISTPAVFPGFTGNVRTAVGDVNGDGVPDTILVTGPGTPIRFAVISGVNNSTVLIPPTAPFPGSESFTGGGFVSAADFDQNGRAEMAFTADQGGGPRVTIFGLVGNTVTLRANFFALDNPNFRGGTRTAAGNVNLDTFPDLAVAAGAQGGPLVALYSGASLFNFNAAPVELVGNFFAFDDSLRNGVYVAIGDVNGDGVGDLVIGAGPGGGPVLEVLNGRILLNLGATAALSDANVMARFFVGGTDSNRGGVRVSTENIDGDNQADVVAGSGDAQPALATVYLGRAITSSAQPAVNQLLTVFGGVTLADGIYVG